MPIEGVDYSHARPGGALLKARAKKFAVRYLYPGIGKGLRQPELDDLLRNGIKVPLVYEGSAGDMKLGRARGIADARLAQAQLESLRGLPRTLPIYFGADWDASPSEQDEIDAYLRGAATVIGAARVGIYGSYWVVKRCFENNTARWLWQTYAWSGGALFAKSHLYQYNNGVTLGGHEVDLCRALQAEYGQNPVSTPVQPTPATPTPPKTAPASTGASKYTVRSGDTLSGIAATHGTTWQALAKLNKLADPDSLRVGQLLLLKAAAPTKRYTVKSGDTLSGIAAAHGTTWQALAKLNNLADADVIHAGQILELP